MFPPPIRRSSYSEDLALLDRLRKQNEAEEEAAAAEAEEAAREEALIDLVNRYQLEKLMRQAEQQAMQEQDPILPIQRNGGSFFHERQRQLEEEQEEALNQVLGKYMDEEDERQQTKPTEHHHQQQQPKQEQVYKRKGSADEQPHTSFREVARVENIPAVSYYRDPHPHAQPQRKRYDVSEEGDGEEWVDDESAAVQLHRMLEEEQQREMQRAADDKDEEVGEPIAMPVEANANNAGGIYTEGGMVYLPAESAGESDNDDEEAAGRDEARSLLANMLGFTRHERLDVKKPGPMIVPPEVDEKNKEVLPDSVAPAPSKAKKLATAAAAKVTNHQHAEDHGAHVVDAEYAHVKFTTTVDDWRYGERIVQAIGEQVNLAPYLTHIRVDQHEVSFRVDENPEKKTAMDVAKAINDPRFKSNLSRRMGVNVLYAGIGDKTQASEWDEPISKKRAPALQDGGIDSTHLMVYMFVGAAVAATIVAGISMFVIKRHDKVKAKLINLGASMSGSGNGTGADGSKDYQELCRARMAGKGAGGGDVQSSATSGRITSLSKENERPPSSRSSTSSWSEEPITNMDISTGHMVLSYMEDHLRNKGRLQREWEALCRYEAEPNSRDAALQESSEKLNRDGAPLPFDHSRVVLNHLANADGLDYINASTIVSSFKGWSSRGF